MDAGLMPSLSLFSQPTGGVEGGGCYWEADGYCV